MTHPLCEHVIDARDLYGMSQKRSASAGSLPLTYFSVTKKGAEKTTDAEACQSPEETSTEVVSTSTTTLETPNNYYS